MTKNYSSIRKNGFRLFTLLCLIIGLIESVNARNILSGRKQVFDRNWKFTIGDYPEASSEKFNDHTWRNIDLPHDWSIEGKVDRNAPSGNDGGYYPTGIGWYRKTFTLPKDYKTQKTGIYFEGVYMNSKVFVNGKPAGGHPYGYSSFFIDITPYLHTGRNTIAVRVDNSKQKNCRWYSGSGIYRHVWIVRTNPVHIAHHGIAISTQSINDGKAIIRVKATVCNETAAKKTITLSTQLADKKHVKSDTGLTTIELKAGSKQEIEQDITVNNPALWSVETPSLYNAVVTVKEDDKVLDTVTEPFGIRTISWSAKTGLLLNGREIKLSGGCLHHDNGLLGAAAYDRAEERKAKLMKAAGFNAVRTSHNIPSEAFLNACDRLGLLVIDEAFDGWRESKNKYDYSTLFDKWWKKDIEAMVLRDRNHPSIFCWSIGNEVIERKKIEIVTTARKLAEHIRLFDNTRPITSALAAWDKDWEIYDPLAAVHDIVGYNYLLHKATGDHQRVPSRVIMQTESYPKDAFDNWRLVMSHKYIIGDFVWTAIDYLGESGIGRYYYEGETPGEHYQRNQYPWHGAYCGDIDITGWRKPISHYRELLYNTNKKLYMAVKEPDGYYGKIKNTSWSVWPTWESWNWPRQTGKDIQVEVYSRYPKVRLYLNGQLKGESPTDSAHQFKAVFNIKYEPGELVATGVDNNTEKEKSILRTAGTPAQISLTADRRTLKADGQDLVFVTVEIKDKNGVLVPDATNNLLFNVSGAGVMAAAGNANMQDTDSYVSSEHKAWKGRAMVIIKSGRKAGTIKLKVSSPELPTSTLLFKANK